MQNVANDDAIRKGRRQPRQREMIATSLNNAQFSHTSWHLTYHKHSWAKRSNEQ